MFLNTSNSPNSMRTARTTGALAIAGGGGIRRARRTRGHPPAHSRGVREDARRARDPRSVRSRNAADRARLLHARPVRLPTRTRQSRHGRTRPARDRLDVREHPRRDPSWFNALAGVTNLLWLGGSIWLAFNLYRNSNLHKAIPLLLPIIWATTILGARIGGGAISALYWIAVGATLAWTGRTARTAEAKNTLTFRPIP
jgi:hypothetical protein